MSNYKQVGFLLYQKDWLVVGLCCKDTVNIQGASPVYDANILPYRQTCACCGKTLVEGQSPAWSVLFNGEYERRENESR